MKIARRRTAGGAFLLAIGLFVFWMILGVIGHSRPLEMSSFWSQALFSLIAIIPVLGYLYYISMPDREKPEPLPMIATAMFCGFLGYLVFSRMLVKLYLPLSPIGADSFFNIWLIQGLGPGLFISMTVFIGLRLFIYRSEYYDQPQDGVIYGCSAAMGFYLVGAIDEIGSLPSLNLAAIGYMFASRVLIYGAIGGIIGVAMSTIKFGVLKNKLTMPLSVIFGAALFGFYQALEEQFLGKGLTPKYNISFLAIVLIALGFSIILQILEMRWAGKYRQSYKEVQKHPSMLTIPISIAVAIIWLITGIIANPRPSKTTITYNDPKNMFSIELPEGVYIEPKSGLSNLGLGTDETQRQGLTTFKIKGFEKNCNIVLLEGFKNAELKDMPFFNAANLVNLNTKIPVKLNIEASVWKYQYVASGTPLKLALEDENLIYTTNLSCLCAVVPIKESYLLVELRIDGNAPQEVVNKFVSVVSNISIN